MMWKHKKRGTVYRELGRGFASIAAMPIEDYTAVVIYQGLDGTIWVRNAVEFDDGRFEPLVEPIWLEGEMSKAAERS